MMDDIIWQENERSVKYRALSIRINQILSYRFYVLIKYINIRFSVINRYFSQNKNNNKILCIAWVYFRIVSRITRLLSVFF